LTNERLFGTVDPLFPATMVELGATGQPAGPNGAGWRNAAAIRRIFRQAFERAGLPIVVRFRWYNQTRTAANWRLS
jgi:hypothetical protein